MGLSDVAFYFDIFFEYPYLDQANEKNRAVDGVYLYHDGHYDCSQIGSHHQCTNSLTPDR